MEILVVDDGSTDSTPEIVRLYADRVRYIRKENGGQASALNLGFAEARGEIVAMLDGDDVWLPQKVRRVVEAFERAPQAVVMYHPHLAWLPDRGTLVEDESFFPVHGRMPLEGEALLRYGDYGTSEISLRKNLATTMFPIPEPMRIYADTYLVFLAVFAGEVVGIPEHLTRYRCHGANLASFADRDDKRMRQRSECYSRALRGGKEWLARNGFDLSRPDIAVYLRRHELVEQMLRYYCAPPGRAEYFRYLRDFQKLYRPLWTRRYRAFQTLLSLAGFVLGYERYVGLRECYRASRLSVRVRESLLPVSGQEAALP